MIFIGIFFQESQEKGQLKTVRKPAVQLMWTMKNCDDIRINLIDPIEYVSKLR